MFYFAGFFYCLGIVLVVMNLEYSMSYQKTLVIALSALTVFTFLMAMLSGKKISKIIYNFYDFSKFRERFRLNRKPNLRKRLPEA